MVQTLEELKNEVLEKAQAKIRLIEHDYNKGMDDCRNGIYDKWFRYNRKDDGHAYDEGWVFQNRTIGNETVQFINEWKIGDVNALLKGKCLFFYDSFNGSAESLTIGRVMTGTSSCVRCCSAMNKENFIYVPYIAIKQLVEEGRYEMCGTVEHILVRQIWTLGL